MSSADEPVMVAVCSACKRASCWQGVFLCDAARGAGTIKMPVHALRDLALENEDYWKEPAQ